MFDIHTSSCVTLNDVDAEIKRLLSLNPSRVVDAARYHFSAGGARVRAQLGLDAASALNLSAQASMACAVAPELLHNASLIHDDLQDGDAMRRDTPAVWSRYGKGTAISAGDLLISAAYMATESRRLCCHCRKQIGPPFSFTDTACFTRRRSTRARHC